MDKGVLYDKLYFHKQRLLINLCGKFAHCSCIYCYVGMYDPLPGMSCIDFTYNPRVQISVSERSFGFAYTVKVLTHSPESLKYLKQHTHGWRNVGRILLWDFHVLQTTRLMQFIHWLYDHGYGRLK